MAAAGGANTAVDGLVFGYDTGYPLVSGNSDTYKFNRGKPTTNIVPLDLSNTLWFNEYSSGRILQSETLFGQPTYEFKSNDGQIWVSPFAFNSYDRSTNDLTLSVYAKNIGTSTASMNTYFGGDYSTDSLGNSNTKSLPADNIWRRYSWTRFSAAMVDNYLEFRTANTGVVISCPQLEIGRIVTPVVNGTRSSTQSLIDLTRTTDIDLSNVSFDSNAQMTFDGTDDYVSLGASSQFNITNSISVFAWIKLDNISGWDGIFGKFNSTGFVHFQTNQGGLNCYVYGPNAGYDRIDSADCYISAGEWAEVGMTFGSNTLTMYLNGVAMPTTVTGNGSNISSVSDVSVGRVFSSDRYMGGNISVLKVYNQALTSQEILQNYNALKERFNL